MWRHRSRLLALGFSALALTVISAPAVGASGFPTHKCGAFIAEHTWDDGEVSYFRVAVFNSNHLSCRTATKVIKSFWGPEEKIVRHGGPAEVEAFYTIKGFPGWRCYTGAAAGDCRRHGKIAGYFSHVA